MLFIQGPTCCLYRAQRIPVINAIVIFPPFNKEMDRNIGEGWKKMDKHGSILDARCNYRDFW
jgi:hypothetical protein